MKAVTAIHLKRARAVGQPPLPSEKCSQLRRPQRSQLRAVAGMLQKLVPRPSCRNPGSNQGPLDLQSNALPTELFRLARLLSHASDFQPSSLPFLHKALSLPERGNTLGSKAPPLSRHRYKRGHAMRCQKMECSKQIPSAFPREDQTAENVAQREGKRSMPRWRSRQRVSLII